MSALGALQYYGSAGLGCWASTGESGVIKLLYLVHLSYIDVTGVMVRSRLTFGGDRHASIVILLFGVHCIRCVLSDRLLTVDCHTAR